MGKRPNYSQAERLFLIHQYLISNAKEETPAKSADILKYLSKNYDIVISRNTLQADFMILKGTIFGLDIVYDPHCNAGAGGYYIANPKFTTSEIKMLIDSVQTSRLVTAKESEELIRKISDLGFSVGKRNTLSLAHYKNQRNTTTLKVIDVINDCINNNKQMTYKQTHFFFERGKTKSPTVSQKETISPYAIIVNHGAYYLFYSHKQEDKYPERLFFNSIHLQCITDAKGIDVPREGVRFAEQVLKEQESLVHFDNDFFRFTVFEYDSDKPRKSPIEIKNVTFLCDAYSYDSVVELFGLDRIYIPKSKGLFQFTAKTVVGLGLALWLVKNVGSIKIIGPKEVIESLDEITHDYALMMAKMSCGEDADSVMVNIDFMDGR